MLIKMRYPLPRGPEFIHNSRAILFFVSVGVVHIPWCASGSQRIALWGPFSPFIFIWVPGIKLQMPGFSSKHLYLPGGHGTQSWRVFFPSSHWSGEPRLSLQEGPVSSSLEFAMCSVWRLWAPCTQSWISACSSSGCHQPIYSVGYLYIHRLSSTLFLSTFL